MAPCQWTERSIANLNDLESWLSTGDDMRSRPEQGPPSASEACGVLDRLVRADRLASLGSIMNVSIGEVIGDTAYLVRPAGQWKELGISEAVPAATNYANPPSKRSLSSVSCDSETGYLAGSRN